LSQEPEEVYKRNFLQPLGMWIGSIIALESPFQRVSERDNYIRSRRATTPGGNLAAAVAAGLPLDTRD